ncbi:MAG: hypothetical protein U9Q91_03965, partial [Candidatus Marinimicrobia bacterium]|nr:hypothetical protein [Candidatus Neomarinimicrobiota bacterium]
DTRILTIDPNKLMFIEDIKLQQSVMVEGEDGEMVEQINDVVELTLEGLLNVRKIVADEIESGVVESEQFVITQTEEMSRVGSAIVKAETLDAVVETMAVKENSRVFVTVRDADRSIFAHVGSIVEGESFVIGLNEISGEDVTVDWWIVDVTNDEQL